MIARLRGRLCDRTAEEVVVDVAGVGYQVFASAQTLAALPGEGGEVELLIVTHLREDALQLFGFADAAERTLFQLLQSVSGIGPRLALNILSGMPTAELREAIRRRDLVRLTRIAGVGKKTAERLSVELADKLAALPEERPARRDGAARGVAEQAVSALVNLGFRQMEAEHAVEAATGAGLLAFEDVIREALRSIRR
ncbi:MAG TPA: Holliday junction branch migration protein RuvA [Candidatus Binatia bacterium]|nr:Holliday junction branch migration protein RuvA [Candidatus Binatia bacterium]